MADEQRIAVLEQHVRALYEQVNALRAELKGVSGAPEPTAAPVTQVAAAPVESSPAPPPRPRPNPAPRRSTPQPQPDIDFEKLFGRYGTIAVASLAILMGVGTFLSWAIEHGYLGPTVRVILGFIGAGIVAALGLWVRDKRDVRFGNVLLALSLAIVHVDAWAAGPHLGVLSTFAALAIAATASVALAALALTSEERTLFAVGFAGALIAPFVTAREPGSIVLLLTYGWFVIAASLFAIRERGWSAVLWLAVLGATGYVLAAVASGPGADHSWLAAHAPVIFPFACAAAALVFARSGNRSKLGLAFLLLASFATLGYSIHARQLEVSVSLFGTVAAYLIARELETDERWLAVGNVIIPLSFLFATIVSASDRSIQAMAAAALTIISALLAWEDEEERAQHLLVTAIASGTAILVYLIDFDTRCIAALALHAALFSIILRSTRAKLLVPPIGFTLMIASGWSFILLDGRGLYQYTPFLTIPSACALACVGAWALFAWALSEYALRPTAEEKSLKSVQLSAATSAIAILIAFAWVRQELVGAWSSDAASFALIIYYALAGLALIFIGRSRSVGLLRAAGLALAFYAGYKTLVETFTIDAIGLRVGARILVGVFLAAVAYWYRVPSSPGGEDTVAALETAGVEAATPSA
ncbi:MAG: DUF2339 domain-containing protein [Gemmatimonadaceae bacterium]